MNDPPARSPTRRHPRRLVVALGGNAITRAGEEGTVAQDYRNLRRSLRGVVELLARGNQVVLTHGNGPQVGNQMIRVELARGLAPHLPLDIVVADLQGGLGYMIELMLRNLLLRHDLVIPVCALLTQVEVAGDDPALERPSKFVGPVFSAEAIRQHVAEHGWAVAEDAGRGWRRVVPSPEPLGILERDLILTLIDAGALVIVTGGGGIPVTRSRRGTWRGVEAVIDKDLAAVVLAAEVDADELYILTSVEQVMIDFGTPRQRGLGTISAAEARRHLRDGQFPAGSMGPKIEAACRFVEAGGRRALITDISSLIAALDGDTGTWVVR